MNYKLSTQTIEEQESRETLQAFNNLWPRSDFKDRKTWLSYCRKWWPKLPEMVNILNKSKLANDCAEQIAELTN